MTVHMFWPCEICLHYTLSKASCDKWRNFQAITEYMLFLLNFSLKSVNLLLTINYLSVRQIQLSLMTNFPLQINRTAVFPPKAT